MVAGDVGKQEAASCRLARREGGASDRGSRILEACLQKWAVMGRQGREDGRGRVLQGWEDAAGHSLPQSMPTALRQTFNRTQEAAFASQNSPFSVGNQAIIVLEEPRAVVLWNVPESGFA